MGERFIDKLTEELIAAACEGEEAYLARRNFLRISPTSNGVFFDTTAFNRAFWLEAWDRIADLRDSEYLEIISAKTGYRINRHGEVVLQERRKNSCTAFGHELYCIVKRVFDDHMIVNADAKTWFRMLSHLTLRQALWLRLNPDHIPCGSASAHESTLHLGEETITAVAGLREDLLNDIALTVIEHARSITHPRLRVDQVIGDVELLTSFATPYVGLIATEVRDQLAPQTSGESQEQQLTQMIIAACGRRAK